MKEMKISIWLFGVLSLLAQNGSCQTLREWIHQKKVQKEYLTQQLTAQRAYLDLLEDGSRLLRTGWGNIQGSRSRELDLHGLFFSSRRIVRRGLREHPLVPEILGMHYSILLHYRQVNGLFRSTDRFSAQEQHLMDRSYSGILAICGGILEDLGSLLVNDRLQLDDFQRLYRIRGIYDQMLELLATSRGWLDDSYTTSRIRERMRSEVSSGQQLFGTIKPEK